MEKTQDELLPSGWQKLFDSKTNRNYYFNASTQESSWKRPAATTTSGGGVWKSSFSKEHNRVYYYNRQTGETRWMNPHHNATEVETEMNGAIQLIANLQITKEKLERDLQASEVSNLALKDQVAQLKARLAAAEHKKEALEEQVDKLVAAEQDLSVQLEMSQTLIHEYQEEVRLITDSNNSRMMKEDLQAKLDISQASVLMLQEQVEKLELELTQSKHLLPIAHDDVEQQQQQQQERLTEPPDTLAIRYSVYDRYKDYRACITAEGDCYNNMGQILGYLNFASLEAGSPSEDYLGCLFESKFDNTCQVRDDADGMVSYLDMGTRSIRGQQGQTLVDFEADGILKHANGTYLGEIRGAKGFHDMKEMTLYLVLIDPGMCSDEIG